MTVPRMTDEVLENAIMVHETCEKSGMEMQPLDAVAVQAMKELLQYRKIGTVEECLRNKDFLDFLSDKMDPDDFEMYLHIYNSLDEKGNNNDRE